MVFLCYPDRAAVIRGCVRYLRAKNSPEKNGLQPFGTLPATTAAAPERTWTVGETFSRYAIWAAVLTFLTGVMAEFLIWTQVVSCGTTGLGFALGSFVASILQATTLLLSFKHKA